MGEMVIPGTYIDVRAEGLISVGGIATGVVGIVGTAKSGKIGEAVTISTYSEAREIFGLPDDYELPDDGANPLTLTRAIQLAYANGASNIIAVRVASDSASEASFELKDNDENTVAALKAKTAGSWGNDLQVLVGESSMPTMIRGEQQSSNFSALKHSSVKVDSLNRIQVLRGDSRRVDTFNIVYHSISRNEKVKENGSKIYQLEHNQVAVEPAIVYGANVPEGATAGTIIYSDSDTPAINEVRINSNGELSFEAAQAPTENNGIIATYAVDHEAPQPGEVLVTVWNGNLDFADGEAPQVDTGDTLTAHYAVEASSCVEITLEVQGTQKRYVVPDAYTLETLAKQSRLIEVFPDNDKTHGSNKPAITTMAGPWWPDLSVS